MHTKALISLLLLPILTIANPVPEPEAQAATNGCAGGCPHNCYIEYGSNPKLNCGGSYVSVLQLVLWSTYRI